MYGDVYMRKIILKRQLESYCKEIYQKFNVIKEIDFKKDIDATQSDEYIYDENGFISFLLQKKGELKSENYITLLGKKENVDGIKIIPTENSDYNLPFLTALFQIDKYLDKELVDIFYMDIELKKNTTFLIRFSNEYYIEKSHKAQKMRKLPNQMFYHDKSKVLDCLFIRQCIKCMAWSGLGRLKNESEPYLTHRFKSNKIRYMMDFKNEVGVINGKKLKIKNLDFLQTNNIYINIASQNLDNKKIDYSTSIKSFIYGSSEGYLYLKSFKIQSRRTQLLILGNSDIKIEQYLDGISKWVDLKSNNRLFVENDVRIRIKLKSRDKIYKIVVLEEK